VSKYAAERPERKPGADSTGLKVKYTSGWFGALRAFRATNLPTGAVSTYLAMDDRAGATGFCETSQDKLAELGSTTKKQVQRHQAMLQRAGLIEPAGSVPNSRHSPRNPLKPGARWLVRRDVFAAWADAEAAELCGLPAAGDAVGSPNRGAEREPSTQSREPVTQEAGVMATSWAGQNDAGNRRHGDRNRRHGDVIRDSLTPIAPEGYNGSQGTNIPRARETLGADAQGSLGANRGTGEGRKDDPTERAGPVDVSAGRVGVEAGAGRAEVAAAFARVDRADCEADELDSGPRYQPRPPSTDWVLAVARLDLPAVVAFCERVQAKRAEGVFLPLWGLLVDFAATGIEPPLTPWPDDDVDDDDWSEDDIRRRDVQNAVYDARQAVCEAAEIAVGEAFDKLHVEQWETVTAALAKSMDKADKQLAARRKKEGIAGDKYVDENRSQFAESVQRIGLAEAMRICSDTLATGGTDEKRAMWDHLLIRTVAKVGFDGSWLPRGWEESPSRCFSEMYVLWSGGKSYVLPDRHEWNDAIVAWESAVRKTGDEADVARQIKERREREGHPRRIAAALVAIANAAREAKPPAPEPDLFARWAQVFDTPTNDEATLMRLREAEAVHGPEVVQLRIRAAIAKPEGVPPLLPVFLRQLAETPPEQLRKTADEG
jgi:hypothetical protein